MYSFEDVLLTIAGCGLVTWLSRTAPFFLLKKLSLPKAAVEYISFVPVVILSALWFSSWFHGEPGHLPEPDIENMAASLPAAVSAVLSKNLLVTVITGIVSMAVVRWVLG
ncbi:MAG TPA: branched-chain amino acid ABC transporter [Veillonellaceae bacterium]|nr:branched-chain amino acid ABC transporter [Veillonellaceae bacterium]